MCLFSWLSTGAYHKSLAIWKKFKNLNLVNLGHFFQGKSFVYRSKFGDISPKKQISVNYMMKQLLSLGFNPKPTEQRGVSHCVALPFTKAKEE